MMSSATLMTVAMVLVITGWTAHKNNQRAAEDSTLMVQGGLEALFANIESLNYDYSAWNAALEAALERDVNWLAENMGAGANGIQFHFLEIFWPTDWSSLTWNAQVNENETAPLTKPIVPLEIAQQIYERMLSIELGEQDTQSFAIDAGGDFYIVAATRVQPWNEALPVPVEQLPINFMAYQLTNRSLADMASTFLIDDLILTTELPTPGQPHIQLTDLADHHIAHLEWTPPRPGDALIRTAALPVSIGLILFLGLSGAVTLMAKRNASELVVREKEASNAARTDAMTGLPNRLAFNESLLKFRKENIQLAVLFMDLNGFKAINDEFGHEIGDRLLREIAALAVKYKREKDMIARLGGDEFNIIFPGNNAEQICLKYCQDLMHRMAESIKIDALAFQPKIAMGYTIGHSSETSISELMRQADYAMYAAKNEKSLDPVKYDTSLEEDKLRESEIAKALEDALKAPDELSVAYQPIIDPTTGAMELAEALVRWNSKKLGSVPPDAFISIAEKTGMIVEVGRRVIDMVFKDLNKAPELHVSINLSPVQLRSRSILNDIDQLVRKHKVDPSRVTFEVTESMMVENPDLTSFLLDHLREQGFGLALDDFGVGFSSIGYLRKFHFDKLKIDKSFVDDIGVASNSENLMRALVYLARSLNMKIVAEGVETEEQSKNLKEEKYDLLQGYLFSRPLPFEGLKEYAAANPAKLKEVSDFAEVA